MIPESTPVLLDTSVLVYLCRGGEAARRIDARYGLVRRTTTPWISVITVGEALALAGRNGWSAAKRDTLRELLRNLVVVDINQEPILQTYARLDARLHHEGRRMGQQNDLWIAATAAATRAVLITTDRDFDALHPGELQREWIDPGSLR